MIHCPGASSGAVLSSNTHFAVLCMYREEDEFEHPQHAYEDQLDEDPLSLVQRETRFTLLTLLCYVCFRSKKSLKGADMHMRTS